MTSLGLVLSEFLDAIDANVDVPDVDESVNVKCPAHSDRSPSLTVFHNENSIGFHCFAGCQASDIATAAGFEIREFFDGSSRSNGERRPRESELTEFRLRGPGDISASTTSEQAESFFHSDSFDYVADRWGSKEARLLHQFGVVGHRDDDHGGRLAIFLGAKETFDSADVEDQPRNNVRVAQFRALEEDADIRWLSVPGTEAQFGFVLGLGSDTEEAAAAEGIIVTEGLTDGLTAALLVAQHKLPYAVGSYRGANQADAINELVSMVGFDHPVLFIADNDEAGQRSAKSFVKQLRRWGVPANFYLPDSNRKDLTNLWITASADENGTQGVANVIKARMEGLKLEAQFCGDADSGDAIVNGFTLSELDPSEEQEFERLTNGIPAEVLVGLPEISPADAELGTKTRLAIASAVSGDFTVHNSTGKLLQWAGDGTWNVIKDNVGQSAKAPKGKLGLLYTAIATLMIGRVRNTKGWYKTDKEGNKVPNSAMKELMGHAKPQQDNAMMMFLSLLAASNSDVARRAHPRTGELLPVANGVLDVRNNELVDPNLVKEMLFTRRCASKFDPNAKSEAFWGLLLRICSNSEQRALKTLEILGSCLVDTGPKDQMFVLFGVGNDGKSALISYMREVLGVSSTDGDGGFWLDWSSTGPDVLSGRTTGEQLQRSLVALEGTRLVSLGDGLPPIRESGLKRATSDGGEVRRLYQEPRNINFSHLLIAATNYPVMLMDQDTSTFKRLKSLLRCCASISDTAPNGQYVIDSDSDKEIPAADIIEADIIEECRNGAVMNLLIAGAHRWLEALEDPAKKGSRHKGYGDLHPLDSAWQRKFYRQAGGRNARHGVEVLEALYLEVLAASKGDDDASNKLSAIFKEFDLSPELSRGVVVDQAGFEKWLLRFFRNDARVDKPQSLALWFYHRLKDDNSAFGSVSRDNSVWTLDLRAFENLASNIDDTDGLNHFYAETVPNSARTLADALRDVKRSVAARFGEESDAMTEFGLLLRDFEDDIRSVGVGCPSHYVNRLWWDIAEEWDAVLEDREIYANSRPDADVDGSAVDDVDYSNLF